MLIHDHIAIIGAGTMGRTIATGILRAGLVRPNQIVLADRTPSMAEALANTLGARTVSKNAEACAEAEVILLCVKPRDIEDVLAELREAGMLWPRALVISIAAGVSTSAIANAAGAAIPVVRVMPNTPCLIGQGMSAIAAGTHATETHVELARTMFATLGRCVVLDEKYMNVVTGLSGSGPAFLYLMIEALADGAVMCGLPRRVATELAAQVAKGAAEMVLTTERHPSALKDDVTTPGGCTIAGLLALEDGKVRSVLARAVERAADVAGGLAA